MIATRRFLFVQLWVAVLTISAAHAQTVIYVDHGAPGANTGTSWHDAFPTLQDALAVAVAPAEIWIAAGTYRPFEGFSPPPDVRSVSFVIGDGIEVYGGFDGRETLRAERNPPAHPVILSGDLENNDAGLGTADNSHHVLRTTGGTVVVDGVTITAGNSDVGGGGILASGSPQFVNCIISHNSGATDGGGASTDGSPTFTGCTFQDNHADGRGGGVSVTSGMATFTGCRFEGNTSNTSGGGLSIQSAALLEGCDFHMNTAASGGGIDFSGATQNLQVSGCSFTSNQAGTSGGALYISGGNSGTNLDFQDCRFVGNTAVTQRGGAIYLSPAAQRTVAISGCEFTGNNCPISGGGVYVFGGSTTGLLFEDCRFRGNQTTQATTSFGDGGALALILSASTDQFTECRDCEFQGNRSAAEGGAVFLGLTGSGRSPEETFTNCSFQGNQAGTTTGGGAIASEISGSYVLGPLKLRNCILWNNSAAGGTTVSQASLGGGLAAGGDHNLIQNIAATGTGSLDGTNPANDPLFAAPVDPLTAPHTGGDLRPGVGSPVLDIGNNAYNSSPTDAGGAPRVSNTTIDFGAREAIPGPEITVRRAGETAALTNGATLAAGAFRFEDGPQTFSFEISDDGLAGLTGLAVTPTGAATLVQPAGSISAYQTTPFEATVTPSVAGPQSVVLSIASNDADENPFEIMLDLLFASDVTDTDHDGLSDYFEWTDNNPATDPALTDTDNDGVPDGVEINLGSLGFVNGRDDSARLAEIQTAAQGLGLYTEQGIHHLALGTPLLTRDPGSGNFTLKTGILTSPDLASPFIPLTGFTPTFNPATGEIRIEFPPPGEDASFYRVYGTEP